jgi:hypothetical protein
MRSLRRRTLGPPPSRARAQSARLRRPRPSGREATVTAPAAWPGWLRVGLLWLGCAGVLGMAAWREVSVPGVVLGDGVRGPAGMVWIRDGEFWLDRHDVTSAQFGRFVHATGYVTADPPFTQISYQDAVAYARWSGKRVATATELEQAKRVLGDVLERAGSGFRLVLSEQDWLQDRKTHCADEAHENRLAVTR